LTVAAWINNFFGRDLHSGCLRELSDINYTIF
jgi:hypothetical protein